MTDLAFAYAPAFRDAPPTDIGTSASDGIDCGARFQVAMETLLDDVQSPGALQRTIDSPFGLMPGSTFARLVGRHGPDVSLIRVENRGSPRFSTRRQVRV